MKYLKVPVMIAFGILALISAGPTWAVPITVLNPSFESPAHPLATDCGPNCSFNGGPVDNWTISGTTGVFHPDSARFSVSLPDGAQTAYSNGGTLSQILAATLQNSTTYTLNVAVRDRLDTAFPGYNVALFAGLTQLGFENSLTPTDGTFATSERCGLFAQTTNWPGCWPMNSPRRVESQSECTAPGDAQCISWRNGG